MTNCLPKVQRKIKNLDKNNNSNLKKSINIKLKKNLNAIILAAGYGSRIAELTTKPKCLLKIQNKTLLEHNINYLINIGITNIYISVGYQKNLIKRQLNKFKKKCKIYFVEINNFYTNGSSFSLYEVIKSQKKISDTIFLHADNFYDPKILHEILNNRKKNVIGVIKKPWKKIKMKGFVIKNNSDLVKEIDHKYKYQKKLNLELACINKFSKNTIYIFYKFLENYLKKNSKEHTWEYPFNLFLKKSKKKFYINQKQNFFWFNINEPSDYYQAHKFVNKNIKTI